jgi:hypothetical protein
MISRNRLFHHRRILRKTRWNTYTHGPFEEEKDRYWIGTRIKRYWTVAWDKSQPVHIRWIDKNRFWAWVDNYSGNYLKFPVALLLDKRDYSIVSIGGKNVGIEPRQNVDPYYYYYEDVLAMVRVSKIRLVRFIEEKCVSEDMRFCWQENHYIRNNWDSHLNYYRSKEKMVDGYRHNCEMTCGWGVFDNLHSKKNGCMMDRSSVKRQTRKIIEEETIEDFI